MHIYGFARDKPGIRGRNRRIGRRLTVETDGGKAVETAGAKGGGDDFPCTGDATAVT